VLEEWQEGGKKGGYFHYSNGWGKQSIQRTGNRHKIRGGGESFRNRTVARGGRGGLPKKKGGLHKKARHSRKAGYWRRQKRPLSVKGLTRVELSTVCKLVKGREGDAKATTSSGQKSSLPSATQEKDGTTSEDALLKKASSRERENAMLPLAKDLVASGRKKRDASDKAERVRESQVLKTPRQQN